MLVKDRNLYFAIIDSARCPDLSVSVNHSGQLEQFQFDELLDRIEQNDDREKIPERVRPELECRGVSSARPARSEGSRKTRSRCCGPTPSASTPLMSSAGGGVKRIPVHDHGRRNEGGSRSHGVDLFRHLAHRPVGLLEMDDQPV